jgi:hypothetical protein
LPARQKQTACGVTDSIAASFVGPPHNSTAFAIGLMAADSTIVEVEISTTVFVSPSTLV